MPSGSTIHFVDVDAIPKDRRDETDLACRAAERNMPGHYVIPWVDLMKVSRATWMAELRPNTCA